MIREAVERYLEADREAEIDRRIVEAYTRQPQRDAWGEAAAEAARRRGALVNRGEVWWIEHPEAGRRPACVLTRQAAIPVLTSVLVAPATRTVRGIPTEVALTRDDGMPEDCALTLDNVTVGPEGVPHRADHPAPRGQARRALRRAPRRDRLLALVQRVDVARRTSRRSAGA